MTTSPFKISFAPEQLWQAINPMTFYQQGAQIGFINIDLGATERPELEREVLDKVGSYGRQIGRIGDALQVLLDHMPADTLKRLSQPEQDVLTILKGQLAEVRQVKRSVEKGAERSSA